MRHSESLDKIASALIAAQKAMPVVHKTAVNPHFRSKFAPLSAITEAAIPALNDNGIVLVQGGGEASDDGSLEVVTRLVHTSGQWIESSFRIPLAKSDPQGAGSAMTYGRRYGLSAMLGIVPDEDDDGEGTMTRVASNAQPVVAAAHTRVLPPKDAPKREEHSTFPASEKVLPDACPKCGGPIWDNRTNKKNPKGPDWSCKDKTCTDGKFVTAGWCEKPKDAPKAGGGPGMEEGIPLPEGGDDDLPW